MHFIGSPTELSRAKWIAVGWHEIGYPFGGVVVVHLRKLQTKSLKPPNNNNNNNNMRGPESLVVHFFN